MFFFENKMLVHDCMFLYIHLISLFYFPPISISSGFPSVAVLFSFIRSFCSFPRKNFPWTGKWWCSRSCF